MNFIKKLPDDLVSKIAAGEVIERPFSVVKELVENSIDAQSKNIDIDIEDGGRKNIVILDDGIGMSPEDASLALERHATSKLESAEDLFRISTLGFRGEALPSIASVSFMTLETTRRGDQEKAVGTGIRLELEGGRLVKKGLTSLPVGTRIGIQNLFFNTPARLKFMKSNETEFSHIANWVESVALSRPEIGFTLRHNGKTELKSLPGLETRLRIRDILGAEIAEFLHPVSSSRNRMDLSGFVTDHRASSTSPKSLYFFVNGRIVRDRTLQHAVLSAYENLLMKHRYPWTVLYLTVPPDFVDVNVHPTKSEVKFANGSLVHEFVKDSVRRVLGQGGGQEILQGVPVVAGAPLGAPHFGEMQPLAWAQPPQQHSFVRPDLRIIGQIHSTYLICETADKLILIDQHAAHERIGFEKLKRQLEEGGVAKQQLLIPQSFDLRPSQSEILKKYLEDLARVGLEIEFFGGNTFLLRAIPVLLEGTDFVSLIEDIVDSLQSVEKLTPIEEKIHEVLERMACHRQVRAGDRLSHEEIQALLDGMKTTNFAGQCPHGRPSILEIPFDEMEKWFKRRV